MYTPPKINTPAYPAPQLDMTSRSLDAITDLIYHHTAGPINQTALEIDQEHRNEGWAMIGYNYIIEHDGSIYEGRPAQYVPSAAYGRNTQSINISLTGNFESSDAGYTGPPTAAQIQASTELGIFLHKKYPSIVRTIGHKDVAPMFFPNDQGDYSTACPGSKFYELLPEIKKAILASIKDT